MVVMVFYVHVVLEPGAGTHDKQRPGLFCLCLFISNAFYFLLYFFLSVVHKVILVTTMLDQFSLTAMAVNYTRAQTQHGPLASHKRFVNTFQKKKEKNNRSFQYFISRISPRHTQYTAVLDRSDSQSGNNKVQFSHTS